MSKLANKTFFRFLFGFVAIIATSFLIISITGYYSEAQTQQAAVECEEGVNC